MTLIFLLALLLLPASAGAVTRWADGALSGNCAGNYNPTTHACGGVGATTENGYGGVFAVQAASTAATAGDTIIVRRWTGGTYTSNVSGDILLITPKAGASTAARTRYEGYSGDGCGPVTTSDKGANANCPIIRGFINSTNTHMINLILDGGNVLDTIGFWGTVGVRAENITIRNMGWHGAFGLTNTEFINMHIHNNAFNNTQCQGPGGGSEPATHCHGVYTGGAPGNPGPEGQYGGNLFDGGRYNNNAGFGLHCYGQCNNTIIRNLRSDHNNSYGIIAFGVHSLPTQVYNVIADHNGQTSPSARGLQFGTPGGLVYSVTSYNNAGGGIECIAASNQQVRNSLAVEPNGPAIAPRSDCTMIQSQNVTTGTASHFANAANGDFRLCTGAGVPAPGCTGASFAINLPTGAPPGGGNLGSPWASDIVGTLRPQGSGYAAGAYEEGGSAGVPLPPAFVAKYAFDGNVNDSTTYNNHGSIVGGANCSVSGKYNQACQFDGVDDNITISDAPQLDFSTAFTIAAWVKPTATLTTWGSIVVKNGPSSKRYFLHATSDYCGASSPLGGFSDSGVTAIACYGVPLTQDIFTHVAMTYNALSVPTIKFYINKMEVVQGGGQATLSPTTGTLQIGASMFGEYFQGVIDEIWLMQGALPPTGPNDANCTANATDPAAWSISRIADCPINPIVVPGSPVGIKVGSGGIRIGSGGSMRIGSSGSGGVILDSGANIILDSGGNPILGTTP